MHTSRETSRVCPPVADGPSSGDSMSNEPTQDLAPRRAPDRTRGSAPSPPAPAPRLRGRCTGRSPTALVRSKPAQSMDRGAADRQRPHRRHDLRRRRARAAAAQRRHAVRGRSRTIRRVPEALAALPHVRRLIAEGRYAGGARPREREDDGAAAAHAVVPDRGRARADASARRRMRRTTGASSISTPRSRACVIDAGRRHLHARDVRLAPSTT